MTTNTQQLAALLEQADAALMSAECHQWLSQARKDINTARNALTKAIRELSLQTAVAEALKIENKELRGAAAHWESEARFLQTQLDSARTERDRNKRTICDMALDIVAVGEALGVPPAEQVGGTAEFVDLIQALSKDKARLDRLDQLNAALNAKYGTTYRWQVIVNHNVNRLMLGHLKFDLNDQDCNGLPSCRDALDTIMPAESPAQGNAA
ncbi:hypothetical protein [Pseudomonas panipatensis]|uniref:Uncharacterized protein n=1 Tax=Pseudomonas panipatensis TaxID=428992 RepID=A0A1G8CT94_9PSED|nr:hypothetical protein [Pseudomonas panipatensis]SDH48702.1 hypothetical protein SAMN05216272_101760 [Pseudomonas panipatensis]SMP63595.1 hypothetical protein SAMN06295951_10682 [Pseudomonas panipatensis]